MSAPPRTNGIMGMIQPLGTPPGGLDSNMAKTDTAQRRCAASSGDLLPPPPPAEKAAACQDQAAGAVRTGDGSASSEASQRKLSFDPRIAGLAEILSAPD